MICKNCGKEINDGVKFCMYCGAQVTEEAPQAAEQSAPQPEPHPVPVATPVSQPQQQYQAAPAEPADDGKGLGIAGFIVSLCGLCLVAGIACGIVGLCLSCSAIKKGNTSSLAKAGKIIGIIDIVLGAVAMIFVIAGGCAALCTGFYY